ncbi:MAG TPA: glycogen debranching protein, partial [Terriglobus sp.]
MRTLAVLCCLSSAALCGQTFSTQASTASQPAATQSFETLPAFALDNNPLVIHRTARPNQPFSVTGQRGAILGQQDGSFELWLLPVKVLHDARLSVRLQGYDADINLNDYASDIEVRPDHTTITYAHAAITVRQHMFIPHDATAGIASAVVLFEVHAARPATLTLSFTPSMERQWPAPNFGRPGTGWTPVGSGGVYSLDTDNPSFFGMVGMPQAQHGTIRPYQERPQTQPISFQFTYDPARDDHRFFPLVAAVSDGNTHGEAAHKALLQQLVSKAAALEASYRSTADYFERFFDTRLTVDSPDQKFNEALRWAEVAIEQSKIARDNGVGLAGGWFTSGDSARPGFGWFFGRDTLWTLYAVNHYGDFSLSRQAMDFLLVHQRADGKMMHEYSQTAETVDWASMPYLYASADSTPLFVMQMEDYVCASGDIDYLKQHWDNVKRAYAFTRAHTTNGVYDNSQGTGWIEEWLPKMPHQEIYLASLDQQSSDAMSRLAGIMNDAELASSAKNTAENIRSKLAEFRAQDGMYAFNRNADGTFERTPT